MGLTERTKDIIARIIVGITAVWIITVVALSVSLAQFGTVLYAVAVVAAGGGGIILIIWAFCRVFSAEKTIPWKEYDDEMWEDVP